MIILHKTIAQPSRHYTFEPKDIDEIKYIHEGCASEIRDAFQRCFPRDFTDYADLKPDLRDLIKTVAADEHAREFLFDRIKEKKSDREVYDKLYLCLEQFVYFNKADIGRVSDIPASHVNSLREMLQILSGKLSSEEVKSVDHIDAEEDPQINLNPLSSKDKSEIENTFEQESFKLKNVPSKVSSQSGDEIRFKRYDLKLKEATSRNSPPPSDQSITQVPCIKPEFVENIVDPKINRGVANSNPPLKVLEKTSERLSWFYLRTANHCNIKYSIGELTHIKGFADDPEAAERFLEECKGENSTRLHNEFLFYYCSSKREEPEKTFGACLDELLGYLTSKQDKPMKTPLAEKMLGRFKRDSDRWGREFAGEVGAAAKGLMDKFLVRQKV